MKTWLPTSGMSWIAVVAALGLWCLAGSPVDAAAGGQGSPATGPSGLGSRTGPATTPSLPPFWPESYLNPEQTAQYRKALNRSEPELKDIETKLHLARRQLDDAMLAEPYDEALVRKKATEIAALETEQTVLRGRALAAIRSSLTSEQINGLKSRNFARVQKLTPEQLEAKREEIRTDLERRVAADHEARRAKLLARLQSELADLRKKAAAGTISDYDRSRITRIESMIKRMEAEGVSAPESDQPQNPPEGQPKSPESRL